MCGRDSLLDVEPAQSAKAIDLHQDVIHVRPRERRISQRGYAHAAARNRLMHFATQIAVLVAAAIATASAATGAKAVGVVSASCVAVLTGLAAIARFERNWLRYRSAAEFLRRELRRYDARILEYR